MRAQESDQENQFTRQWSVERLSSSIKSLEKIAKNPDERYF